MASWESSGLLTYPNQRVLHHEYSSGADDNLSRASYLSDTDANGTRLVAYQRLGLGQFVRADFHKAGANDPVLRWNLAFGTGSDPYDGLDAFGRVKDHRWTNYAGTSDKVKIEHGYLCPCQLGRGDFWGFAGCRGRRGTGWRSCAHKSLAA